MSGARPASAAAAARISPVGKTPCAPSGRGADTARLDIALQAAGLLAASLGLSRMYRDDHAQLEAAMSLYDAFYRWSRDAVAEAHNWPSPTSPAAAP